MNLLLYILIEKLLWYLHDNPVCKKTNKISTTIENTLSNSPEAL